MPSLASLFEEVDDLGLGLLREDLGLLFGQQFQFACQCIHLLLDLLNLGIALSLLPGDPLFLCFDHRCSLLLLFLDFSPRLPRWRLCSSRLLLGLLLLLGLPSSLLFLLLLPLFLLSLEPLLLLLLLSLLLLLLVVLLPIALLLACG